MGGHRMRGARRGQNLPELRRTVHRVGQPIPQHGRRIRGYPFCAHPTLAADRHLRRVPTYSVRVCPERDGTGGRRLGRAWRALLEPAAYGRGVSHARPVGRRAQPARRGDHPLAARHARLGNLRPRRSFRAVLLQLRSESGVSRGAGGRGAGAVGLLGKWGHPRSRAARAPLLHRHAVSAAVVVGGRPAASVDQRVRAGQCHAVMWRTLSACRVRTPADTCLPRSTRRVLQSSNQDGARLLGFTAEQPVNDATRQSLWSAATSTVMCPICRRSRAMANCSASSVRRPSATPYRTSSFLALWKCPSFMDGATRRRCRARSARKRRRAISKDCRLISPVLILMASTDSNSTIERLEIRDREPGCSRTRSMYSDPFSLWYRFASALVSRK